MSINSTSTTGLFLAKEDSFGVLPVDPSWQTLRFTSESLNFSAETVESDEIISDRQMIDKILVGFSSAGDINFEFSNDTFDTLLEGVMQSSFDEATGIIENGDTQQFYSIEKKLTDNAYEQYKGMAPNTMSLSVEAKQKISGAFGFIGKNTETSTTPVATSPAAPTSTAVMTASTNVANISGFSGTFTQSLSIDINNNLREAAAVGELGSVGVGNGTFTVTGQAVVYFKDHTIFNALKNRDRFLISFDVTDSTGAGYKIELLSVKIDSSERVAGGKNQDLVENIQFTALRDPASGKTLRITKL
ncbi:phage tail tube protein [Idiomarina piscisalsi]|uniref:Phage tail protein n=1 Tax=Idiomarina piscisalsi TaxID=1096243 RepID=A0A432YXG0_9GAMM|nr:phage tail tube protein [Idiomarina piscisalsi]RUO67992.1 hypothetical protein CWI73_03810 [Idiomarina piscisalsi]